MRSQSTLRHIVVSPAIQSDSPALRAIVSPAWDRKRFPCFVSTGTPIRTGGSSGIGKRFERDIDPLIGLEIFGARGARLDQQAVAEDAERREAAPHIVTDRIIARLPDFEHYGYQPRR
jgi:hypothetical protein